MGDGFMASFGSAQRALECAIDLQRAMGELPPLVDLPDGLRVRAGINAGEPIAEAGDLFGSSVIAAARIASRARGGQVLVSDVVRQLVLGKGFRFEDAGEHALKGLDGLVRLWELRW
jgi:class 3 adenylate cyclase